MVNVTTSEEKRSMEVNSEILYLYVGEISLVNGKSVYIVTDIINTEEYVIESSLIEQLVDEGCSKADAFSLIVMAKNALGSEDEITDDEIMGVLVELLSIHHYMPEKIMEVLSELGECEAYDLFSHKKLPDGLDKYLFVMGWDEYEPDEFRTAAEIDAYEEQCKDEDDEEYTEESEEE